MEVSIGPGELFGIRAVHTDVAFVVLVEVSPDSDDVFGAAGVERQAEANVRDEIVEALLTVKSGSRKGEGKGSCVFDTEGEGRADVSNRGFGNGSKASSMGPAFAPGG